MSKIRPLPNLNNPIVHPDRRAIDVDYWSDLDRAIRELQVQLANALERIAALEP